MALVDRRAIEKMLSEKTRDMRHILGAYKEEYLLLSCYTPVTLINVQQITLYEGTNIHTAYMDNAALHFGNRLRECVKLKQGKTNKMTQEMKSKSFTDEETKSSVKGHITDACTKIKLDISLKRYPDILGWKSVGTASAVFRCLSRSILQVSEGVHILRRESESTKSLARVLYIGSRSFN